MLAGAILSVVTSIAYIFTPPFWPFLFVRVVQGIGSAFFFTAALAYITNITPGAYRGPKPRLLLSIVQHFDGGSPHHRNVSDQPIQF